MNMQNVSKSVARFNHDMYLAEKFSLPHTAKIKFMKSLLTQRGTELYVIILLTNDLIDQAN